MQFKTPIFRKLMRGNKEGSGQVAVTFECQSHSLYIVSNFRATVSKPKASTQLPTSKIELLLSKLKSYNKPQKVSLLSQTISTTLSSFFLSHG